MEMKIDQNSLVVYLTGYIQAMSRDIASVYLSHSDWERDFSRLSYELGVRGSRVLTIDLPALGKHLDQCLDQGQYTPSSLFLGRVQSRRVKVPVFLRSLYLRIFDHEGKLRDTPDLETIYCLRTLLMAAKKLRLPFTKRSVTNEIRNFIRIEAEIDRPHLNWGGDDLYRNDALQHADLFGRRAGDIQDRKEGGQRTNTCSSARIQPESNLGWTAEERVRGALLPGSPPQGETILRLVAGNECTRNRGFRAPNLRTRTQRSTSVLCDDLFGTTSTWPMSKGLELPVESGSAALALLQHIADRVTAQFGSFEEQASEFPKHGPGAVADRTASGSKYHFANWSAKLQGQYPADLYGDFRFGASSDLQDHVGWAGLVNHEPPSRLIAVPKTQKGPRLIAAEPIAHQWIQQLVKTQLEAALDRTPLKNCISFRDQSLNGRMAQQGSLDGSFATIDLSSASDRLSARAVESLLRVNEPLLEKLHACRTRWMVYDRGLGKEYLLLNKFSTMGSAVTFPVQSIVYAYVAIAAVHIARSIKPTDKSIVLVSHQVRVFGDDIIVPSDACQVAIFLLEELGLRVNTDKTFFSGNFRESCGVDAWRGHDVTPPYLLEGKGASHLKGLESHVKVSNNFHTKGFWHVADWLCSQIERQANKLPIVPVQSGVLGIASFCGSSTSHLKSRWNEDLQRTECNISLPYSKQSVADAGGYAQLFQWLIERQRGGLHSWKTSLWPKVRKDLGPVVRTVSGMRPGWVPLHIITSQLTTSEWEEYLGRELKAFS